MLAALAFTAVYLGGAGADDCDDVTFDSRGYAYLACHSSSEGFIGVEKKDMDAYVVKFDPQRSKILYATRIGGNNWDAAFRVVVDAAGAAWVSGTTQSADFPLKSSERCYFGRGAINAFVARLDAEGKVEYLAMIGDATAEGLVVAPGGKVYLAGTKAPSEEKHYAFIAEIQESGGARILTLGPGTVSGIAIDGRGALFAAGFSGRGALSRVSTLRPGSKRGSVRSAARMPTVPARSSWIMPADRIFSVRWLRPVSPASSGSPESPTYFSQDSMRN